MLNKNEIINICKDLKFNPEEYCLGYGGALVLYGIKEGTSDIDINVTEALFNTLSEKNKINYAMFDKPFISIDGVVEVFIGSNMDSSKKVSIEGIPVAKLECIIEAKKRLGRPKDFKDIELIEEYLRKTDIK